MPGYLLLVLLSVAYPTFQSEAQSPSNQEASGLISGVVVSRSGQEPIPGATVQIVGTSQGTGCKADGSFTIPNLRPGIYSVQIRSIGFEPAIRSELLVRPGRATTVRIELAESIIELRETNVRPPLFTLEDGEGRKELGAEEIRRSPGSAGDVSRVINALPSVSKVADNFNDLMVRGGSPVENGFLIDNVPVANINHFPVIGGSGGGIGAINVDFIDDVSFSAGGFGSIYGDRLSSVTEISYREGNRLATDAQLDLSVGGLGGVIEGPLGSGKGSYMLSARRSYLDVIVDAIGTGFIPKYGDIQGKAVLDLSQNHRLELLDFFGNSSFTFDKADAVTDGQAFYGDYDALQNTVGLTWRWLIGPRTWATTTVSHSFTDSDYSLFNSSDDTILIRNDYTEQSVRIRSVVSVQPSARFGLKLGLDGEGMFNDYNYLYGPNEDRFGNRRDSFSVVNELRESKAGFFASSEFHPIQPLRFTLGVRTDYFSANDRVTLSPRFSASVALSSRVTLTAAGGRYYQTIPSFLLSQQPSNFDLKNPYADHAVAGISWLLRDDTKLTLEGYGKWYGDLPLDPADPTRSVIDEGSSVTYNDRFGPLVSAGEATSRGLELTLQRKLLSGLYGLLGGSISQSRYRDLNGIERPRGFDNRHNLTVVGGFRPSNRWEYSFRWSMAGGNPFTPYDIAASTAANSGILDEQRINDARYPVYHSLNLQVERKFLFTASSLTIYFSVLNIYNRENVAFYYWNQIENKQDSQQQWSILPFVGIEYEL